MPLDSSTTPARRPSSGSRTHSAAFVTKFRDRYGPAGPRPTVVTRHPRHERLLLRPALCISRPLDQPVELLTVAIEHGHDALEHVGVLGLHGLELDDVGLDLPHIGFEA